MNHSRALTPTEVDGQMDSDKHGTGAGTGVSRRALLKTGAVTGAAAAWPRRGASR
jgi:hypothetical protein